jgi:outer membrane protein TolC
MAGQRCSWVARGLRRDPARRPDIRRAEALLHSATADVGVAVGSFYPSVTLSGSVSLQALQLHNLASWASRAYAFGPSVTLPIFEAGQLKRTLELRKTQQQEAAVIYQHTVLSALHEVDNALTAYDAEQHRRAALEEAVALNQRALALARALQPGCGRLSAGFDGATRTTGRRSGSGRQHDRCLD